MGNIKSKNKPEAEPVQAEPVQAEYVQTEPAQAEDEDCSLDIFKDLSQIEQIILIVCIILVLYLLFVSFTGGCSDRKPKPTKSHVGRHHCNRCGRHVEFFQTCAAHAPSDPCCTKCYDKKQYSDAVTPYNAANCTSCKGTWMPNTGNTNTYSVAKCNERYAANSAAYDAPDDTNDPNGKIRTDIRLCGCLNTGYQTKYPNVDWVNGCSSGRPKMDNFQLNGILGVAKSKDSKADRSKRYSCIMKKTNESGDDTSYASAIASCMTADIKTL